MNENINPFEGMSFDQISSLPNDEFMKRMKTAQADHFANLKDTGDPNYATYTHDQKIAFWENVLNTQMRRQIEGGLDPYLVFSNDWYRVIKNIEPDIDIIMDRLFASPGFQDWKKAAYLQRIR